MTEGLVELELRDLLNYALGGQVPDGFLEHLIRFQVCWDDEFWKRLDEFAYELRPDLAVWEVVIAEDGTFSERRLPLLIPPRDSE